MNTETEYKSGGTLATTKNVWCNRQPMLIKPKVEQKERGTGGLTMETRDRLIGLLRKSEVERE